ncbi:MAG: hypothetical protein ABJA74_13955 [Lapillicoccus sp.]
MAMTLRLNDSDDALLSERAAHQRRSKQDVAREAIHTYLTDEARRLEDLEDELAIAQHRLRKELGDLTFVRHDDARARLGLITD